jgi:hypothetical protein
MPTTPTVIPLIVAGLMLGSLLVSGKRKVTKKKLLGVSMLSGLLNAANAFIVYTLFPPTTFSRFGGGNFGGGTFAGATFTGSSTFQFRGGAAAGANSEGSFILLSFLTGLLIVIVVVGVALAYVRYKGEKGEEELDEAKLGEQEELEEPKQEEQEEI